jgi:hypothetical protein
MMRKFIFLTIVVLLAGCQTPPPQTSYPDITFSHETPFTLTVSQVQVDNRYQAPMRAPNIEHVVPVPPERALRRWAQDRIKPSGQPGTARFIINQASIVETNLKMTEGIRGVFTKDQSARFDATVEASIEILDERGFRRGFANARVSRSNTMPENATLNDRDKILFQLVDDIMKDFDQEMERSIRQYLVGFMM